MKHGIIKNSFLGGIILVSLFWGGLLTLVFMKKLSLLVVLFYALMGIITFIFYAVDKSAAVHNRWRISENTLHLLSLVGGWSGAFLAQMILHHKSSKESFQVIYKITVFLNLFALAFFIVEYSFK
jgi:uncharacterized membrane protein YsdA (DUF1294 family)